MRTRMIGLPLLLAIAVGFAVAQGPGYGRGAGMCGGYGQGHGGGYGQGMGGWWNRVIPKTAEQREFVAQVSALHAQIFAARQKLWTLQANNADPQEIAAAQRVVTELQAKLTQLQTRNIALMRQLGVNCPGVCDGTGRNGRGRGGNCPWRANP